MNEENEGLRRALHEQEQKEESGPLLQQLRQEIITLKVSFTRAGAEGGEWPTPPATETGDHYSQGELYKSRRRRAAHSSSI
jgi:hypothetical protein